MKTKYMQSTHNPFNSQGKMFHHLDKLNEYIKTGDTYPILVEINPTNKCPLKCKWCISGKFHKDEELDPKILMRFLRDFKKAGGKAVNWSGGGEPTAYYHLEKVMHYAHELGLDQGLMTNGVYSFKLNESIPKYCSWVRFSLDTSDSERYKEIKGKDCFHKVVDNIEYLSSKMKVGVNMNLPQETGFEVEIYKLSNLVEELGAKYFQIRPVLPRCFKNDKISKTILKDQIDFLKFIDGQKGITISWDKFHDLLKPNYGRSYTKCRGHKFECVLDANGDLDVCMYHLKNEKFKFGNIYTHTFKDIWNSRRREFVSKDCDNLDLSKCQICCKCHEINKLLDYIDNKGGDDINFI